MPSRVGRHRLRPYRLPCRVQMTPTARETRRLHPTSCPRPPPWRPPSRVPRRSPCRCRGHHPSRRPRGLRGRAGAARSLAAASPPVWSRPLRSPSLFPSEEYRNAPRQHRRIDEHLTSGDSPPTVDASEEIPSPADPPGLVPELPRLPDDEAAPHFEFVGCPPLLDQDVADEMGGHRSRSLHVG